MVVNIDRDKIIWAIAELGLTQVQFCAENGIATSTLGAVLRRENGIPNTIARIANGLGVSSDELVKKKYAL